MIAFNKFNRLCHSKRDPYAYISPANQTNTRSTEQSQWKLANFIRMLWVWQIFFLPFSCVIVILCEIRKLLENRRWQN